MFERVMAHLLSLEGSEEVEELVPLFAPPKGGDAPQDGDGDDNDGDDKGDKGGDGDGDEDDDDDKGDDESAAIKKQLERLQRENRKLRKENASRRTKTNDAQTKLEKLQRLLGLEGDDKGDDGGDNETPETKRLKAELRRERIENSVARMADKLGADAELTLAFMEHKRMLEELDPEEESFKEDLELQIRMALKANPKLRATRATGDKTGGEFGGGGKGKRKDEDKNEAFNDWFRREAGLF